MAGSETRGDNAGLRQKMKIARTLCCVAVALIVLFGVACCNLHHALAPPRDYSPLIEYITFEYKKGPLYVFEDFKEVFDTHSHKASLEYFNNHPELLRKIQTDLDGGALQWKLGNLEHRLVFVPEKRKEYAALFESYCSDVTDYILDRVNLKNPYHSIRTLCEERPEIPNKGVTAFIVHKLAREFISKYIFFNENPKAVQIEVTGKVFLGEPGSYTTTIVLGDNGAFEIERDRYTIWQSGAKSPRTVLMTPVEETLHIALREHTEKAIKNQIKGSPAKSPGEWDSITEEWIAVEEAIVGGLVHDLFPDIKERYFRNFPYPLIGDDLAPMREIKEYRHLQKGIEVVERMGSHNAVRIYAEDPGRFRKLLLSFSREEILGLPSRAERPDLL